MRIDDLLTSLTALIIQYHDHYVPIKIITETEVTANKKASHQYAITLLDKIDYTSQLERMIQNCLTMNQERQHLLTFINTQIQWLNNATQKQNAFSASEFENFTTQIACLLQDIKTLLITKKTDSHRVSTGVDLYGLLISGYMTSSLSYSGTLLCETLSRLNITTDSTDEEIQTIARNISTELQNHLLVFELTTTVAEKEQELSTAQENITQLRDALASLEHQFEEQQHKLVTESQNRRDLQEQLATARAIISRQQTHLERQPTPITPSTPSPYWRSAQPFSLFVARTPTSALQRHPAPECLKVQKEKEKATADTSYSL